MKNSLRVASVLGLAATGLVLQVSGASALSCVDPTEWYADAEHVFVGSVADVDGSRIAFEVREVWQGDDLAERVWLRRAQGMDVWYEFSVEGEVEEGYSSPRQYVVAVQEDLVVSPCGLAPVDGSGYGVPGADSPRPPVLSGEGGVEPEPSMAPVAVGGVGVIGAGALGALWWRRRRA
jgi:MYXO-CTERM domain-containing protein